MSTIADDVLKFLGQPASLLPQAQQVVEVITVMASDYTRGKGFTDGIPDANVRAVIVTASARLLANPDQLDFTTGSVSIRSSFDGWNRLEKTLLNSIRKTGA